eukprot:scaffold135279_cov45-Prasinocladus_malaysianus.AAC.2
MGAAFLPREAKRRNVFGALAANVLTVHFQCFRPGCRSRPGVIFLRAQAATGKVATTLNGLHPHPEALGGDGLGDERGVLWAGHEPAGLADQETLAGVHHHRPLAARLAAFGALRFHVG